MSDKDLLGKADGLMRRHSAVGADTGSVPVLTDLVDVPPAAEPIERVEAQAPQEAPAAGTEPEPALAGALPGADELTRRVMSRVDERLAAEMQRVRSELAEAVAEAVRDVLGKR